MADFEMDNPLTVLPDGEVATNLDSEDVTPTKKRRMKSKIKISPIYPDCPPTLLVVAMFTVVFLKATEEGRRVQRPKCCELEKNQDENNSPKHVPNQRQLCPLCYPPPPRPDHSPYTTCYPDPASPVTGVLIRGLLRRKQRTSSRRQSQHHTKFSPPAEPEESVEDTKSLIAIMKRSGSYSSALDDIGNGSDQLSSTGDRLSVGDRLSLGGSCYTPTPTGVSTNGSIYTINMDMGKQNSTTITPSVGRSTADLVAPSPTSADKLAFTDPERDSWDNKFQYLLSAIGLAVGLGNVWRFPYLAQKNGGGAFLFPYIVMLFLEGLPIFYMELAIGQRMRNGPIGTWSQISPYLGGIGFACVMVSYIVGIYYNTIIAWCLYYLVQSFRSELLWSTCPTIPITGALYNNETRPVKECELAGPTAYFWYRSTLDISTSIDENGHMLWHLELSILCAWIIVFFCMIRGIASSGKVVYFTATFPYIVLVIFFFRGVTLKNFQVGLVHMFLPKFDRLVDPQVWLEAANQIFYSLGLAFGGLMAMSSYNPVNNNCLKDAYTVVFINCGTSVFAGIVIFSILGFKASASYDMCLQTKAETGGNITCDLQTELDSTASGPGLAFIAFTEAINQFPAPPVWSILFFLMLLTLGLDSMFGSLECVTTCVMDSGKFPDLKKKKFVVPAFLCLTSFLISLCFATQSGSYTFLLFDEFTGGFPLMVIALFEILSVSYIYGLNRFAEDVELMVGIRPNYYWLLMWKYISPLVIIIILFASILKMLITGVTYEVWDRETASKIERPWPGWSLFVASLLILSILIWIPMVYIVKKFNFTGWKKSPPKYFPRDELRREKNLKPYILSDWEKKYLFIFEGLK